MKYLLLLLAAFTITAAQAQKTINDPNAEVRTVSSFHGLDISSAFEVTITQGGDEAVAVSSSSKEDVANIKTVVSNGVLKISYDSKKFWQMNKKLRAYISVRTLDLIRASGASTINIEGQLTAQNLKLDLSGASRLKGKITVSNGVAIDLSGASDLSIQGSAQTVSIDANGASDVKAYEFSTTNCIVDASGASTVHITVDKELSAKLSGASSVSYKGAGLIRDIKTSGASSVTRKS